MFISFLIRSFLLVSLLMISTTCLFAMDEKQSDHSFTTVPVKKESQHFREMLPDKLTFSMLPDELHLSIFFYLNQKDVPSVSRVCKSWNRLMNDNWLWKKYTVRACGAASDEGQNYKELMRDLCTFSFTWLDTLNGANSRSAEDVSADGFVVVGSARNEQGCGSRAFRWTLNKGMESLGTLNGGDLSFADGVSANGSVIVGTANNGAENNAGRAFRWTRKEGMESLGVLNDGGESSAHAISADGSVIVGVSDDGFEEDDSRAFRWTRKEGMESLGVLNDGQGSHALGVSENGFVIYAIHALDVNENGSVIVGFSSTNYSDDYVNEKAFRWTRETGMESLGGEGNSIASGVSANGSTIVGKSGGKASRWTPKKGLESLGTLHGATCFDATDVSADGSLIVGSSEFLFSNNHVVEVAIMMSPENGMQVVSKHLAEKGIAIDGVLNKVHAITPNGVVLVGKGRRTILLPTGAKISEQQGWRAVIPRKNLF